LLPTPYSAHHHLATGSEKPDIATRSVAQNFSQLSTRLTEMPDNGPIPEASSIGFPKLPNKQLDCFDHHEVSLLEPLFQFPRRFHYVHMPFQMGYPNTLAVAIASSIMR
jgi:hypothetical protein